MWSSYNATDHDPLLTEVARSATPIRTALTRFHDYHARYPASEEELRTFMSKPPASAGIDLAHDWLYTRNPNGSGFSLWHKLGWDPALLYELDGAQEQWIFDPGDGSPRKFILLQP